MAELSSLPNISISLETQLNAVGIETIEQLIKVGSRQAWLGIKAIDNSACINRLYALEGAIQGVRWHGLTKEVKNDLLEFYNTMK